MSTNTNKWYLVNDGNLGVGLLVPDTEIGQYDNARYVITPYGGPVYACDIVQFGRVTTTAYLRDQDAVERLRAEHAERHRRYLADCKRDLAHSRRALEDTIAADVAAMRNQFPPLSPMQRRMRELHHAALREALDVMLAHYERETSTPSFLVRVKILQHG